MKPFVMLAGLLLLSVTLVCFFCFDRRSYLKTGRLSNSEWVGTYHAGGGLYNHELSISAFGRFSDRRDDCLQHDQVTGIVDDTDERLRLTPLFANRTSGVPLEYLMIRWDQRRYLVPPEEILDFCAAVREGCEPRNLNFSHYLLMKGDEKSEPDSTEPRLPHGFERYLRMKELDVGIKSISKAAESPIIDGQRAEPFEYEYDVTLDAGSFDGVLPRMRFRKHEPHSGPELVIRETSTHESKGFLSFRWSHESPVIEPKVGDRFWTPTQSANSLGLRRIFPFAGKVTIDGRPPQGDGDLIVMLYDRKAIAPVYMRPYTICRPNGEFSFCYSRPDDGTSVGTYVLLVTTLSRAKKPHGGYVGPDQLNNLYNDPDKNLEKTGFVIEHKKPGKTDYVFDLKVRGIEPVRIPGPRALTELTD